MNASIIRVQTAIIGAGVSSIAACINLLDNNYENFLVFEALERIGGRVFTDRDG
jgi:monoamine oxidase